MIQRYDVWQTFARNLRAVRERAGLSQAEVAAAMGVKHYIYAGYEQGRQRPGIERFRRLCEVLQVSADTLLFDGLTVVVMLGPAADDPPELRRLMRQMRRARPQALRFVARLLDEIDRRAQGWSRAPEPPAANNEDGEDP